MTEKLYDNSKLTRTEAEVIAVTEAEGGFDIATSKTVFFPGGGGQDQDTGIINGQKVTFVYEKDGLVFHRVGEKIDVGTTVVMDADRAKRESDMAQKTWGFTWARSLQPRISTSFFLKVSLIRLKMPLTLPYGKICL